MVSQSEENSVQPAVKGFWTGEMIAEQRAELFDPPRDDAVDCAAYTLRMGAEVYISPTDDDANAKNTTVRTLEEGESFTIPPGQFAFLLTEEIVSVPADVIAFISMKAKVKWRGLINVSGFHADPGFKGRLVFAVFNAGPVVVHLRRGDDLFLIWFADLKQPTKLKREKPVQEHITSDLINSISGELQSLPGLNSKIKNVEKSLGDKVHAVEKSQESMKTQLTVVITLLGALLVALLIAVLKGSFAPEAASNAAVTSGVVSSNIPAVTSKTGLSGNSATPTITGSVTQAAPANPTGGATAKQGLAAQSGQKPVIHDSRSEPAR